MEAPNVFTAIALTLSTKEARASMLIAFGQDSVRFVNAAQRIVKARKAYSKVPSSLVREANAVLLGYEKLSEEQRAYTCSRS